MTNFENLVNLIKYPLITEKAMNLYNNQIDLLKNF